MPPSKSLYALKYFRQNEVIEAAYATSLYSSVLPC